MLAIRHTSIYLWTTTDHDHGRQWLRDAIALPPNGRSSAMTQHPNRILNVLPQNIFAAVQQHLKPVELAFGDIVAETGQPVERVPSRTPA